MINFFEEHNTHIVKHRIDIIFANFWGEKNEVFLLVQIDLTFSEFHLLKQGKKLSPESNI